MTSHLVLGKRVDMPVEIRAASAFSAMYSVPTAAAQSLIDYSSLEILQFRPGRGVCVLVFVDYVDGDLGPYNEFGVAFLVRDHRAVGTSVPQDLKALAQGRAGALIHHLPVDGDFTLAAGRSIWGFPKVLADFDVAHTGSVKRGSVSRDGRLIAQLSVKPGIPVPGSGASTSLAAYSHLDGLTRFTTWDMAPGGVRSRPGGAELKLGSHPIADELRSLGLPRRALVTSSIPDLKMTFGDARPV
ncbi:MULTISPECIES: acetoacetate decarboxylase family protein [unclassified Rhodococcus (in: high G+C Gram-positive bacteria)]|uniref:acetoacetate decarboxylase family protein n=1 Tax=unclassified Rhodococcus (in: high G+C Gram-positive bacteria) TaxID=192944 RepID=UPI00163B2F92|nr:MULTISPECIES: acetoacetate decarboxylase family protein [unclassified Rhodococcus (in: high G+C Gram-positive bacteria)]MBC2641837.1 acetoacetate decarboxylase family protein [Rhodococcus sp. 3A]MBC2893420.1 acetoacetate decarboxylase family protein [Rhodococcus sp. 4CII]